MARKVARGGRAKASTPPTGNAPANAEPTAEEGTQNPAETEHQNAPPAGSLLAAAAKDSPTKKRKRSHDDVVPEVPTGEEPTYAPNAPKYLVPLRRSIIQEVGKYTHKLVIESETRILEAINKLAAAQPPATAVPGSTGNSDSGPRNAFDYPDLSALESGTEAFVALRRFWSFHRAIAKANAFRTICSKNVDLDLVFDAITCVTEAIAQGSRTSRTFSIWSYQSLDAFTFWRAEHGPGVDFDEGRMRDIADPDSIRVGRKSASNFIIPFMISPNFVRGNYHARPMHTVLLDKLVLQKAIGNMLQRTQWAEQVAFKYSWVQRQPFESHSCGLLTILNSWAMAIGLKLNRSFKFEANPKPFFDEAIWLVNLGLSGYLDAATIYHRFLSKAYVQPLPEGEVGTKLTLFSRTWPIQHGNTVEDLRKATLDAAQLAPGGSSQTGTTLVIHTRPHHPGSRQPANIRDSTQQAEVREKVGKDTSVDDSLLWNDEDRCVFESLYPEEVNRRQAANAIQGFKLSKPQV